MGLSFSKKQKITSALYAEFKKQRGDKPRDKNFDYEYACFLENKIAEMYDAGKPVKTRKVRFCPKCRSRFGIFLSKNIDEEKSEVICFNGYCDFRMNVLEWNKEYPKMSFTVN